MAEGEDRTAPLSQDEAVLTLANLGREFVEAAAIFTPGPDDILPPLGDGVRAVIGRNLSDSMIVVRRLLDDMRFDPERWHESGDLPAIVPAVAGFIGSFESICRRFDPENPAGLRVSPTELAAMERGLDSIGRWGRNRPTKLPRGWWVAANWEGISKIYLPPPITVEPIGDGAYRVTIGDKDDGETFDLDTPKGLFFKAIVEADGRPITFAEIEPLDPSLEGLNPTRDLRNRLPDRLRDLILPATGYRLAAEKL